MTGPLAPERLLPPTPGQLRRLLAAERLRPSKALSQNFLTDATVIAVELDPRLAAYLRRELSAAPGFELIEADALALHPRDFFPGEDFKLIANIPYHITSPLLHAFLEGERPPSLCVLLVQAEVGARVAAAPGQMSYLSVFVQNVTEAEVVGHVDAVAFEPAPDVDSAILRLRRRAMPQVPAGAGREPFYRLVQAGFRQRRKQLHNALGRELPVPRTALAQAFAACGIDSERRAQTLSLAEWDCLNRDLAPLLATSPPTVSDD